MVTKKTVAIFLQTKKNVYLCHTLQACNDMFFKH